MFGELPKIFDKNFVLSFFFPSLAFIVFAEYIFQISGVTQYSLPYINGELVNDLSVIVLFSYLGGVLLLIINRELYRFLEGYSALNPFKLVSIFEKGRYQRILQDIETLDDEYRECIEQGKDFPTKSRLKRNKLMNEMSNRFPDKEEHLLPTAFGNIIRSFEIYPRVMYGIDYIDSWSRLQAVMPADFRELVDNAKARTDLWVNFQFITALLIILTGYLLLNTASLILWILLYLFFIANIFSIKQANASAFEWGDYAKSSFDIFVPKLREALGFPVAKNRSIERQQWTRFSQAIIYRLPEYMPEAQKTDVRSRSTRKKGKTKSEATKRRSS